MVWGTTGYSYDGTDLKTLAYHVSVFADQRPGMSGGVISYANEHGVRLSGRRYLGPRQFTVGLVLFPQNTSGVQTVTSLEHIQANAETLKKLFWSSSATKDFVKTMPDGDVRTIEARVENVQTQRNQTGVVARMAVTMFAPYPIWAGAAQSYLNQTGSFSAVNNGDLPAADLTIHFDTAGRITHNPSGAYLESDTANLTVNIKDHTIKVASTDRHDALTYNKEWWMEVEPGSNSMTVNSGTVDLTFNHGWD